MAQSASTEGESNLNSLRARHANLDRRVRELDRRAYLTPAEQSERSDLKKLKLALKDRISVIPAIEAP